ncbi:MAG: hypothetical protein LRY27_03630 [Chitinophagales bacterium]|nr:hypothetical protein [Chitinophagales bacterium]
MYFYIDELFSNKELQIICWLNNEYSTTWQNLTDKTELKQKYNHLKWDDSKTGANWIRLAHKTYQIETTEQINEISSFITEKISQDWLPLYKDINFLLKTS